MSASPEYQAQTSFNVQISGSDSSIGSWDFPNIEVARAIRDELTRLIDGLAS